MFSSYYMDRYGHVAPNKMDQDAVPVAVVPFEDREQVERLAFALADGDQSLGTLRVADALREFATPKPTPRPTVYSHIVSATANGISIALCGKVWKRIPDVNVVGKCPSCADLAKGWTV